MDKLTANTSNKTAWNMRSNVDIINLVLHCALYGSGIITVKYEEGKLAAITMCDGLMLWVADYLIVISDVALN
jgi:hypothetical protein